VIEANTHGSRGRADGLTARFVGPAEDKLCVLHYTSNNAPLVGWRPCCLIDAGLAASANYYNGDITPNLSHSMGASAPSNAPSMNSCSPPQREGESPRSGPIADASRCMGACPTACSSDGACVDLGPCWLREKWNGLIEQGGLPATSNMHRTGPLAGPRCSTDVGAYRLGEHPPAAGAGHGAHCGARSVCQ